MLLYPTIQELTKGEFNRYELVVAVAKGTRMVTDEYISRKENNRILQEDGKRALSGTEACESDEEKPMTITVRRIRNGEYKIITLADDQS